MLVTSSWRDSDSDSDTGKRLASGFKFDVMSPRDVTIKLACRRDPMSDVSGLTELNTLLNYLIINCDKLIHFISFISFHLKLV